MFKYKGIKETSIFMKIREKKHRFVFKKKYKPMREAMQRFRSCVNKKSKSQIKKEINLCKKFWGCYPLHYFREDLYRKDRALSESELLNYIPEFFFYDLFLPYYNSDKHSIILSDKIITEQVFRSLNIPQPHTICNLINNRIYSNELVEKTFNNITQELSNKKYERIFVKPLEGKGGYGIYIFKRTDKGTYITNDNELFNEDFIYKIGTLENYIIQDGVKQAQTISRIYPHSINTFRICTENKNGNVRLLFVEFRLGRNGNEVDNTSQGGLLVDIDIQTGKMGSMAFSDRGERLNKHPDTNFIFDNHKIENWNEVKDLAFLLAKKLPQFTYLGLDIALSNKGPVAIEANLGHGLDPQSAHGGLRDIFQIDDPQFYWRNRGKRGSY